MRTHLRKSAVIAILMLAVWSRDLVAQSSYEIIELKLPNEPAPGKLVQFLNNSGQVAGSYFGDNGGVFVARWEPGRTNLTDVRYFGAGDFTAPPGVIGLRLLWGAFFDSGEGYAKLIGERVLDTPEAHPANGLLRGRKYFARILRYSGGAFTPVMEFESFQPTGYILASGENMVRILDHEFGGDQGDARYPRAGETWNPHLPHYPEVWTMHDLHGGSSPLPTGIDVLNLPGDYRYLTYFMGIDDSGMLYGRASYLTHPLTSFGRLYTGTRYEVWVNGSPRSFADFAPPWGHSFAIQQVNRSGEISGTYGPLGLFGGTVGGRAAIYLPRPNYGLPSGIHTLTTTTSLSAIYVSPLNRQGALIWGSGNSVEGRLWSGGVNTPLNSLVATGATPQVLNGNGALLNDQGWFYTQGRNPDQNGPADIRHWLLRPALTAEASLSTNRVFAGDTFTFTLRVRNLTSTPRTLGLPIGFRFSGDARFQLVGASTPPGTRVVPAFGSFAVQQVIRATNAGTSTWYSQGRLFSGGTSNDTALAYTESLRVLDRADLLIKRAGEPDGAYGVDNEYQAMPAGPQVRTNGVRNAQLSEFHVRVQNDDTRARTFRLKADEGFNADGWDVRHLLNGADLSAAIRAGHVLPQLAAGQSHQVTLRVTSTNAPPGDPKRVLYTLEEASEPGEIRDVVEAVTELGGEIIVNSTGDETDADPLDNVADVDLDKPGLQTTLRAAIELANQRAGKDVIQFDIQPEGNEFEDGIPRIAPRTGLPLITDAVEIDGWSQSPSALSPPVLLTGTMIERPGEYEKPFFTFGDPDKAAAFLLDWSGAANGLHLITGECEIRGLVINEFPLCGIRIDGSHCIVQGNYLGTDATGTISRGNGFPSDFKDFYYYPVDSPLDLVWRIFIEGYTPFELLSEPLSTSARLSNIIGSSRGADIAIRGPHNLIGGNGTRERNVISGRQPPLKYQPQVTTPSPLVLIVGADAHDNRIIGNIIGLDPSGTALPVGEGSRELPIIHADLAVQPDPGDTLGTPSVGIFSVGAPRTIIGGSAPGEGNVVAGNFVDIYVLGDDCVVQGNRVGARIGSNEPLHIWSDVTQNHFNGGIFVEGLDNLVGGPAPAAGNVVLRMGVGMAGSGGRVQNNWVGLDPASPATSAPERIAGGIVGTGTTNLVVEKNTVRAYGVGIHLLDDQQTLVQSNRVFGYSSSGLLLVGSQFGFIVGNVITNSAVDDVGAGIEFAPFNEPQVAGMVISANSIHGNRIGIASNPQRDPTPNDVGDSDSGPNTLLNHPRVVLAQQEANGTIQIQGRYSGRTARRTYRVEFFANRPHARNKLIFEGETYVGATTVETDFVGEASFSTTFPGTGLYGQWLTATAIDADGNTSEFSPGMLIEGVLHSDPDGMSDEIEMQIPNRVLQVGRMIRQTSNNGDGNGDGLLDSQQANVASFPALSGDWWTLVSAANVALSDVSPTGSPDFSSLPAGYAFPVGFVSLTVSNLAPGGTVVLTNILHGDVEAATAFAYGPTPGQPQPHWHELAVTVVGDELRLALTDGELGDHDLVANGRITTIFAPAYPVPPGPSLTLLSHSTESVPRISLAEVNGQSVVVTNQVPRVTSVLSWPGSATNWLLQYRDQFVPSFSWRTTIEEPTLQGGQNIVTNSSTGGARFFRLRRF